MIIGALIALKGLRFARFLIPFVIAGFGFSLIVQGLNAINSPVVITYTVATFAALIFFAAGYFFYKVALVVEFASIGFSLVIIIFHLLGMDNSVIPFIVALVFAILAGFIAITVKIWNYLILFGTALSGATLGARGVLTIFLNPDQLSALANNSITDLNLSTTVIVLIAIGTLVWFIIGSIFQIRQAGGFKNVKNFEMSFFKITDKIPVKNTKI